MQQSDYILREIEKISIMLMGMLGKMVRRNKEGVELNEDEYSALTDQLCSESKLDLEEILQKSSGEFEDYFRSVKGFDEKNIEILADLIESMAGVLPEERREQYYQKAFEIYHFLDISFKTFSFERMGKKQKLEDKLNSPQGEFPL